MELDIHYVAGLARLQLTAEERKVFGKQLKSILSYVEKLSTLETEKISPTFQTIDLKDEVREDKVGVKQALEAAEALNNAPRREGKFFSVPKVFDS